ncbi:MAG: CBS domain-containing protein [Pseudomonadota bacterium]
MPKKTSTSQSKASNLAQAPSDVAQLLRKKGNTMYSVSASDTLLTVVEMLRSQRIGAVLVVSAEGELEGILSERDVVRKLADVGGDVREQLVHQLMTRDVKTCSPSDHLLDVLQVMTDGRFRHMPVVENDKLIGIVTIGDVVNHRLRELEHETISMKQMIVG